MSNIFNLLSFSNGLSDLLCDTDECLSYVLVLLNILTIFYLVYTSYRPVTKIVRVFGYLWASFIMCFTVLILFFHTCIFTILCAVFTGMNIIAVLSTIMENKPVNKTTTGVIEEESASKKAKGCYVIHLTDDEKFTFALHTKSRRLLAKSTYKYNSLQEAKDAIQLCRQQGVVSGLEDATGNWVLDVKHPKFRLYIKNHRFVVDLAIKSDFVIIKSDPMEYLDDAIDTAKLAMNAVGSDVIYFATGNKEIYNGDDFELYGEEPEPEEDEEETEPEIKPVEPEPVKEEVVEEPEEEIQEEESATLSESLSKLADVKTIENLTKLKLYQDYSVLYNDEVELYHRDNETSTGLPLADTYFAFKKILNKNGEEERKKTCFAYVYEKNGGVLMIVKLDKKYARQLKKTHNKIYLSRFPKSSTNDWFSVLLDETYTESDVNEVIDEAKKYCENN